MILELVEHDPLIWPTIEENGVTRINKYEELSTTEKIQADCDLKATNVILQGLPFDVYSLVNYHRVAKDPWEIIQLLMQGTSLRKQERECKFQDPLALVANHQMTPSHFNTYESSYNNPQFQQQFSPSHLPPERSKFVTDVKLVRDFHTTNFDQLNAYLKQHELHAKKSRIMREHNQDPLALVANHQMTPSHFNTYQSSYNNPQFQQQFSPSQSPQYGSIHPTQHYSTTYPSIPRVITYPSTPYPNAYSSIVHQDAFPQPQSIPQIEYTRSTVNQQTHLAEFSQIDSGLAGRQSSFAAGTFRTRANISGTRGNNSGQQRVVKCFNYQRKGHMVRQCLKPKRKKDATCFRDKVLLVEAQGSGKVLNKEELEVLADPRVVEGPVTQTVITHTVDYQADDLDAYDSDCDDFSTAKTVLMANLSCYRSDILSEVPHSENTHNDMLNQSMQEMSYSK
uniref:Retrovirus-related Pol polyprotein from transposon TNT 1-94 n=1 Tax=Tanacetum cinerariifolium TaxID=118510 RepID=A0A699IQS7_TANCI|nr:hypothetical protein [Tanacetum cinerariifolium]